MKSLIVSALLLSAVSSTFASAQELVALGSEGSIDFGSLFPIGSDGRPVLPPGFPTDGGVVVIDPIGTTRPEEPAPAPTPPAPQPTPAKPKTFVYFRCNSTSWDLSDKSQMQKSGQGYSLTYTVKEAWMQDAGDSCSLVTTDKKGQWTGKTKEYVVPLANGEVAVESTNYTAITRQEANTHSFRVRYSSLGNYTAYFDPKTKSFSTMKLYFHGY